MAERPPRVEPRSPPVRVRALVAVAILVPTGVLAVLVTRSFPVPVVGFLLGVVVVLAGGAALFAWRAPRFWWRCVSCGHEYRVAFRDELRNRLTGPPCPACGLKPGRTLA